ncbi:hypothetical protein Vretimale_3780, partial [Volvox reticuliferus]
MAYPVVVLPPSPNWFCGQVVSVLPSQQLVAYGGHNSVVLASISTRAVQRLLSCGICRVSSVALAPELAGRSLVAAGCEDGSLRCWDWSSGEQVRSHRKAAPEVTSLVALVSSPVEFVAGDAKGGVTLWVPETGIRRPVGHSPVLLPGRVTCLAACSTHASVSVPGSVVVAGVADGGVHLVDVAAGQVLLSIQQAHRGTVHSLQLASVPYLSGMLVASPLVAGNTDGAARARHTMACMGSAGSSTSSPGGNCQREDEGSNPGGGFSVRADAGAAVTSADASGTAGVPVSGTGTSVAPSGTGSAGCALEADLDAGGAVDTAGDGTLEHSVTRSTGSCSPQVSSEAPDLWLLSSGEDGQAKVWSFPALKAAAALTATATGQKGGMSPPRPQPLAAVRLPPPPPSAQHAGGGHGTGAASRRLWVPAALLPGCDVGGSGSELVVAMAAPWGHVLLYHVSLTTGKVALTARLKHHNRPVFTLHAMKVPPDSASNRITAVLASSAPEPFEPGKGSLAEPPTVAVGASMASPPPGLRIRLVSSSQDRSLVVVDLDLLDPASVVQTKDCNRKDCQPSGGDIDTGKKSAPSHGLEGGNMVGDVVGDSAG